MLRLVSVMLLASCISSGDVECPDGRICPDGTVCFAVTEGTVPPTPGTRCVNPDNIAACADKAELDECSLDTGGTGTCHDGACFASECGNGLRDVEEACDDGNLLSGDGCAAGCNSTETCGNNIVDPVRDGMPNERCDDGDRVSHDGCSATCQLEVPRWRELEQSGAAPRAGSRMVFDSTRRRFVGFGGRAGTSSVDTTFTGSFVPCTTTATPLCITWSSLVRDIRPPARGNHAMAYDRVRDRVVMFGGSSQISAQTEAIELDDHWEFDGTTWTQVFGANAPTGRISAAMAYDPISFRIVMYGGFTLGTGTNFLTDTYEWDGATWTRVGDGPRLTAPVMAFDPVAGSLLLTGSLAIGAGEMETWRYDRDSKTWKQLSPAKQPTPRSGADLVLDGVRSQLMLVGGVDGSNTPVLEVSSWNGTTWTDIDPLPSNLRSPATASDPFAGLVVAYAGETTAAPPIATSAAQVWNGTAWISDVQTSFPANTVANHAAAYDARRDRTLVVTRSGTFELAGPTWIDYATNAPGVFSPAMAYDAARDNIVLFGGSPNVDGVGLDATWVWNGTGWTQDTGTTHPSGRGGAAMAYEATTDRLILFGGRDGTVGNAETWAWAGSWSQVTTTVQPSKRSNAAMAYDWLNRRIVLFGGINPESNERFGDTWAFDPATNTWERVSTAGPLPRSGAGMAWNNTRRRIVLFGGTRGTGAELADTWEWDGATWTPLQLEVSPLKRSQHTLTTSARGVQMIGGLAKVDVWEQRWESGEPDDTCLDARDFDRDGEVGCADADCRTSCQPLCVSQPSEQVCIADAPTCGNQTCEARENCRICPEDCTCDAICGDSYCEGDETVATCPGDCTHVCGDGVCDADETIGCADCP